MVQDLSYHPPIGESDHVCLTFNLLHTQQKEYFTPMYNIFKTNYVAVRNELQQHNWYNLLNSNFEDDYETFFHLLNSLLGKHSPMNTQPKKKKNIYMNNEAVRLKNAKGRLGKRYITTRTKFDRENYIRCKNGLRALTRTLRSNFEQNLAFNVKSKPKLFWKYAKSRMKTKQSIPSLTKADGSRAITPKDKVDALNNFFRSVLTIEDLNNIPSSTTSLVEEALSNIQITHETVLMKLKVLNPNKSPGHDKWHPYFLSELADIIRVPLSILFNKYLKEGTHKSWMKAVITAIYKKELRSLPENYRPISITSVISKIMNEA